MKFKNISTASARLLNYFNSREKKYFFINEAYSAMNHSNKNAVKSLLSDMVRRGLLMRLKEGLYHIIPYEKNPASYSPNWRSSARYLIGNKDYYFGYNTALNIMTSKNHAYSIIKYVVVNKQIIPSTIKIRETIYQFVYHNETHFFGFEKRIENEIKIYCSDLEKSILDCLFKPANAGGIPEILLALEYSLDKMDYSKLLSYIKKFNSNAVIKRLGFLLEHLQQDNDFLLDIEKMITKSFTLLDPLKPKEGRHNNKWRIRQNVDLKIYNKSSIIS